MLWVLECSFRFHKERTRSLKAAFTGTEKGRARLAHTNVAAALAGQTRGLSIQGTRTECWGKSAKTRVRERLQSLRLGDSLNRRGMACAAILFHKFVCSFFEPFDNRVALFELYSLSACWIQNFFLCFKLLPTCFVHCSLVLLQKRSWRVVFFITSSMPLLIFIDLCHFSFFSFHSVCARLKNPSIFSCSLYASLSICLVILVSCFAVFIILVYLCWLSSAILLRSTLLWGSSAVLHSCLSFFIALNSLILLASFVTLLLLIFWIVRVYVEQHSLLAGILSGFHCSSTKKTDSLFCFLFPILYQRKDHPSDSVSAYLLLRSISEGLCQKNLVIKLIISIRSPCPQACWLQQRALIDCGGQFTLTKALLTLEKNTYRYDCKCSVTIRCLIYCRMVLSVLDSPQKTLRKW